MKTDPIPLQCFAGDDKKRKDERFISGDLGMLNGGLLILEMGVLLLGHLHKQSTVGPTHADTDPIHYISFRDALLHISSVKGVRCITFQVGFIQHKS